MNSSSWSIAPNSRSIPYNTPSNTATPVLWCRCSELRTRTEISSVLPAVQLRFLLELFDVPNGIHSFHMHSLWLHTSLVFVFVYRYRYIVYIRNELLRYAVKSSIWNHNFFYATFGFSVWWQWRVLSSGMWHRVNWWTFTDVSEERTTSIFRAMKMEAVNSFENRLHCVTSNKIIPLINYYLTHKAQGLL
jgi:hypothetical protein